MLLLEAGGKDRNPWIHIPLGYAKTFVNPRVNWMFDSEPEPNLNNRTMYQPRGKVLGGTSSINGMIYIRGNHADYDEWRQRGCEGWDWESVLPYFRKAEDNQRGASEFHGAGGPLHVANQPYEWEIGQVLLQACQQAGIPYNPDFNGAQQEGCGWYQTTTKDKRRWSTAVGYLRPAQKRPNLEVRTHAHATRILLENGRAVGLEFRSPRGLETVRARGEVIVSGGAYGSPQLLLLSGIGPAEHLQDMGIEVAHRAPRRRVQSARPFQHVLRLADFPRDLVERAASQHPAAIDGRVQIRDVSRRTDVGERPVRRRLRAQRQAAGATRSAVEYLRLEHDRSHPRRHRVAPVSRVSPSARCICGRKGAARCGCVRPTRWRRRRSVSTSCAAIMIIRR